MKLTLSELKHLNPRDVWPNEAHDFTPWLAEHIDKLGGVLGMDLEVSATEEPVGEFSVDIRARDLATGLDVVIENQYGATDHDHLGKLLTYASGVDAFALVWIAESIRDEHRQALEWLNERTDTATMLFAIELEVLQIDQSAPACSFNPVVFPNKWQKATRERDRSATSPRGEAYRQFFQALVDELRDTHHFTRARTASALNWFSFPSGTSGVGFNPSFAAGARARVEVYIDPGDAEENKKLFDWLETRKESIEAELGEKLEWERLDDRRASRIAAYREGAIHSDAATLEGLRAWMVQTLLSFREVFAPLLKEYKAATG